jgi:tetratricopeptide (TPR) repeat protein
VKQLTPVALAVALLHSTAQAEPVALRAVNSTVDQTTSIVRLELSKQIALPTAFTSDSSTVVVDLDNVKNIGSRKLLVNKGNLNEVNVRTSGDRTRVTISLTGRSNYDLTVDGASIVIVFKPPSDTARTKASAAMVIQPTIEFPSSSPKGETPDKLLANAKIAYEAGNFQTALEKLNGLLILPPSASTQEGQELIGQVRERLKQPEKAMAEYKAFIAMYPDSPAVARTRQRLLALEIATPDKVPEQRARKAKTGKGNDVTGSVATYLYVGAAPAKALTWTADQQVLINNASATATFRDDQYTVKVAGRGSVLTNLLDRSRHRNSLSVFNVSLDDSLHDYGVRLGRQNATAGILGRFDGASGYYNLTADTKMLFGFGAPYLSSPSTRRTASIGIDSSLTSTLGVQAYLNKQKVDGVTERSALGLEGRYFNNGLSLTGTVEYDTLYKVLNTSMVQGTWVFGDNTLYFLADRRLAPALFAERLLQLDSAAGPRYGTVGEAFGTSGFSRDELYAYLAASSPVSKAFVVSWSNQITPKWLGSISGQTTNYYTPFNQSVIPTEEPIAPVQTISSMKGLNVQLLGSDTPMKGGSIHLLGNYSKSKETALWYTALLSSFAWRSSKVDVMLRTDRTMRQFTTIGSVGGSVRLNYKFDSGISIETQYSLTRTTTVDELMLLSTILNSQTFFIGFRYEI